MDRAALTERECAKHVTASKPYKNKLAIKKKNFMAPFLWMEFNCLKAKSHFEKAVYFLPLSSQKFLVYTHFIDLGRMKI